MDKICTYIEELAIFSLESLKCVKNRKQILNILLNYFTWKIKIVAKITFNIETTYKILHHIFNNRPKLNIE